jgi:hypothetical protein
MLHKDIHTITAADRQKGKSAELACGFGGALGAWRRIANDEADRSDAEVQTIVRTWRSAHPKIVEFWQRLMRAARISLRTKQAIRVMPAPRPAIITDFDGYALTITLPSSRPINYPGARLVPNRKFEDGDADIEFFDNARGQWKPTWAWFGTIIENTVQAVARDLLAAAIIRAEARGWKVVFHCHDELVIEAPVGEILEQDVLALLLEPPAWAAGLPLGGKVHSGPLYLEAPATAEPPVETGSTQRESSILSNSSGGEPDSIPAENIVTVTGSPLPWEGDLDFENPSPRASSGAEPAHICIHCHLQPPDGSERASAYSGAWLHERCEDAFIHARMAEEGILTESEREAPPPQPPPPPPPPEDKNPSSGNGHGDFDVDDDTDDDAGGDGYGYPHGEREIGRKVAEFFYRNIKGALYLKVVKRVTKSGKNSFPQYHLENGQWVKGKPEGPALPYRVPELLAAPANATVEICEGEKDADNLAKLGLIATTNPGGAGKWTPDLNKWFAGFARANVYEDNDTPGHKHAAKIASELTGIIPDIRIITFRELPEHSDVSDWLKIGKTREELIARAQQAPKFIALQSVCATDEEIEDYDWVWPGRFALKKIGLLTGLPDEGKGVLLSDIIARVTRGAAWPCGEGSAPTGNVILLTAEDDIRDTIIPRLMAADADLKRVHIIKMMRETGKQRMFSLVTDLPMLQQKVIEVGNVKLIVIDPVAAYLGIGKIDSFRATDVRAMIGPLKEFAEELRIFILGVMHFNKKMDVTNLLLRVSDSLAYTAAARHVYGIVDDPDNDRKLFVKRQEQSGAARAEDAGLRFQRTRGRLRQANGKTDQ